MKKINFNFSNLSKPTKTVFIFSIILTSVVAFDFLLPLTEAASITRPLILGTNIIDLRDISNTANQTSSISGLKAGSTLEITVTDLDANADLMSAEIILSSATSDSSLSDFATTVLTETGLDTGEFRGTITLSSEGPTSGSTLQAPGNDVAIGLGCGWGQDPVTPHAVLAPDANNVYDSVKPQTNGDVADQAGTIMHELGHNLGLGHGSAIKNVDTGVLLASSNVNCRPTNVGVMTYAGQTDSFKIFDPLNPANNQ